MQSQMHSTGAACQTSSYTDALFSSIDPTAGVQDTACNGHREYPSPSPALFYQTLTCRILGTREVGCSEELDGCSSCRCAGTHCHRLPHEPSDRPHESQSHEALKHCTQSTPVDLEKNMATGDPNISHTGDAPRCDLVPYSQDQSEINQHASYGSSSLWPAPRCDLVTTPHGQDQSESNQHAPYNSSAPWKCSRCPAEFTHPGNLKRHENIHSDKRIRCNDCGKRFPRMDTMRRHNNAKHQGLSGWTDVDLSLVHGTLHVLWKDGGDSSTKGWEEVLTIPDITRRGAFTLAEHFSTPQ